jgi:hypothetical protein
MQDLLDLCRNVRLFQFVEGFERPDDFGDDKDTGCQFGLAAHSFTKQGLRSLCFDRIVVRQKPKKYIRINKVASHGQPLSWRRSALQTGESSQNPPAT